jgi:hypothetical protein
MFKSAGVDSFIVRACTFFFGEDSGYLNLHLLLIFAAYLRRAFRRLRTILLSQVQRMCL